MLTVISPAKRLNSAQQPLPAGLNATSPAFLSEAAELVVAARDLTATDLQRLMGISAPLAQLNVDRFANFSAAPENGQPAALLFAGDTYAGLEAKTLDTDAWRWAQDHLRILSGLYGLLRPLDRIQPYRLEMGSRMANARGGDLYAFWGESLALALNQTASDVGAQVLINCASVEYFGAVAPSALQLRVITPVFLEMRADEARIISFWAKKARGAMARFITENRLSNPDAIKEFDTGGYQFSAEMTSGNRWVFLRDAT
ncbi:MAG: peroxide stress protein YaaA [Paracoccaceae bacterium]|nr:peroxide stress protein YaaA [Paracoccaceae bacterium]